MGGGYPKQGMSLVALDWMLAHAADSGLGAFYRWAPRDIRKYCARNGIPPRIHLTVAERIANATDDNAPGNIPPAVTVATTPVDRDAPRHTERERILGRRAEAVQAVLQQALADTYLLDKARTHVVLGDGSYWLMVIAWLMVALGGLQLAASAARPDPGTFTVAGALIAVGLVCLLCARFLGGYADHAMTEIFSEFWQQHQQHLRHTLKTAHEQARESSARVGMSSMRRG